MFRNIIPRGIIKKVAGFPPVEVERCTNSLRACRGLYVISAVLRTGQIVACSRHHKRRAVESGSRNPNKCGRLVVSALEYSQCARKKERENEDTGDELKRWHFEDANF